MTALLPTLTDGQLVGVVILLVMLSPFVWVVREYVLHRRWVRREWADIDRDLPLLDRIARDEWSALLAEEGRRG